MIGGMENKQYIVYIDESNISTEIGNSVYCAIFIFIKDKDMISRKIITAEDKSNINYLHWVDMPWKLRIRFAEEIKSFDFICKVIIYKNPIKQEVVLDNFIENIINSEIGIMKIIIDGNKNSVYLHKLKRRLKNKGIKFSKLMFVDDKVDVLIRLADFIAGLARSYTDNKNKNNTYMFNILKNKIKILN